MAHLFRFRHVWRIAAPVDAVYAVCAEVDAYPTWWREVRSVERVDADRGIAVVRSVLPYRLRLGLTREVEDPEAGRLRVRLDGDLTGWAEFSISPSGESAQVTYDQEVTVTARGLRLAAPLLGPVLRANHTAMMRSCERGMSRTLRLRS